MTCQMPVKVLIVDDSPTQRRLLAAQLACDRRLCVVGCAGDAAEARQLIKALIPDVVTLDIEMPGLNGLEFLSRIMRLRPMPVVMLSGLTPKGSQLAIEALSLGAVDCLEKSPELMMAGYGHLADRVFEAAHARPMPPLHAKPKPVADRPFCWNNHLVMIGASTGGVTALEELFAGFPKDGPPIVVAQHMPASYITRFADRLDGLVRPKVCLGRPGQLVEPGHIYFAPGGDCSLGVRAGMGGAVRLLCSTGGDRLDPSPSVNAMFVSAVPMAKRVVAVLLSGMGRDGVTGMLALRKAGARCLVQARESATIFGMPGAAIAAGAAEAALPLDALAADILKQTCTADKTGVSLAKPAGRAAL